MHGAGVWLTLPAQCRLQRRRKMVNPGDIREAEKFGMVETEIPAICCPQCDTKVDLVIKCDECGRECCSSCWFWIPSVALRFCGKDCAIKRLLTLLEIAENK